MLTSEEAVTKLVNAVDSHTDHIKTLIAVLIAKKVITADEFKEALRLVQTNNPG